MRPVNLENKTAYFLRFKNQVLYFQGILWVLTGFQ